MGLLSNKYLHWSYTWQSSQRKLQKDDEPSQPLKRMNLDVLTSTQKVDDPTILDNGDERAPSTLEPEWTWKKILIDKIIPINIFYSIILYDENWNIRIKEEKPGK